MFTFTLILIYFIFITDCHLNRLIPFLKMNFNYSVPMTPTTQYYPHHPQF